MNKIEMEINGKKFSWQFELNDGRNGICFSILRLVRTLDLEMKTKNQSHDIGKYEKMFFPKSLLNDERIGQKKTIYGIIKTLQA